MRKLLIANRGEIALRVMRTARAMGIATVAVYSDADSDAPFVRVADEAVRLGPAPARESYLAIPAILDAARVTGADAVHPGYGFLAENAQFAEAVTDSGLVFVGPPAAVIRSLGNKQAAKRIADKAGVPIVPGYLGDDRDLGKHAAAVGYPLLVKAAAGGGGKGMRIVRREADLADALERARGEAASAFGDDSLLLERYVERPRHVEIQILGDTHGDVVHVYERECSIQRRHQKIVEESPSPAVDDALRAKMGAAAVALGKAVGYVGAGTVEFVVPTHRAEPGSLHSGDPSASFYFLEVNTRLQVEHPVTELVTGLDLVREQIRIARGERVPVIPPQRGWAIEVRLCAEDADREYLPTTGHVLAADVPAEIRAEVGVAAGSDIGIHYDSMIGKLIASAPTRVEAAQRLRRALEQTWLPGVVTNREQLARILAHPAFLAGALDTHFLETHAGELAAKPPGLDRLRTAAIAAALYGIARRRDLHALAPAGWRNVRFADQLLTYDIGGTTIELGYRPGATAGSIDIAIGGKTTHVSDYNVDGDRLWFVEHGGHRRHARVIDGTGLPRAGSAAEGRRGSIDGTGLPRAGSAAEGRRGSFGVTGLPRAGSAADDGARIWVLHDGAQLALVERPRFPAANVATVSGALTAPMPGKVVKVLVAAGQVVVAGAALVVLEAMKMEHTVRAGEAGTVRELHVAVGDQVDTDRLLAIVTA